MGRDIVMSENEHRSLSVVWPEVEDGEGDDSEAMDVDDTQVGKMESEEDRATLQVMFYQSCQIPRLMKIAILVWYYGKVEGQTPSVITQNFESDARTYYKDAYNRILHYNAKDFALLLLACTVHWLPVQGFLLGSKFEVEELVNDAVIFPYIIDPNQPCCYVIPSIFWFGCSPHSEQGIKNQVRLVEEALKTLVPGLNFCNLRLSFSRFWTATSNLTELGKIWEDLIAASLASKYCLWKQLHPNDEICVLSDIYHIEKTAYASQLLSSLHVNFSQGIKYLDSEVSCSDMIDPAIYVNGEVTTAHHDIIIWASSKNVAIQCKHSLSVPTAAKVKKQLNGTEHLLWFSLGTNEDLPNPLKFKDKRVCKAIKGYKVVFLSGAGCVGPFNFDLCVLMKKLQATLLDRKG